MRIRDSEPWKLVEIIIGTATMENQSVGRRFLFSQILQAARVGSGRHMPDPSNYNFWGIYIHRQDN